MNVIHLATWFHKFCKNEICIFSLSIPFVSIIHSIIFSIGLLFLNILSKCIVTFPKFLNLKFLYISCRFSIVCNENSYINFLNVLMIFSIYYQFILLFKNDYNSITV